jgi:hypothetical protein
MNDSSENIINLNIPMIELVTPPETNNVTISILESDLNVIHMNKEPLNFKSNSNREIHEDKIKDILKHLRNETIKLFLKTFQVKHKCIKFYLILIIALATTLSGYMLVNLIINYLAFDVLITTRSITETKSVFPKITICNANMFQSEYALDLLKDLNRKMFPNVNIFDLNEMNNASFSDIDSYATQIYTQAKVLVRSSNFTNDQRKSLGKDLFDLIYNFKFSACQSCQSLKEYFTWYFDVNYGNCYMFNSGYDSAGKKLSLLTSTEMPGSEGSLSFDFYVGYHENLTLFNSFNTKTNGAIIRIENNSYLIDTSFGVLDIHVSSGVQAYFKMQRSFEHSLPKPYSNCDIPNDSQETFIQSNDLYRLFANSPYQYARQACFVQCYQRHLIQSCNCSDTKYLSLFNVSDCLSNEESNNCMQLTFQRYSYLKWQGCLEICPLECNRTRINTDFSFASLNNEFYWRLLHDSEQLLSDFVTRKEINRERAVKCFVSLNMFYDTLSYDLSEETAKMNLVDLMASIGGNLSLFLGVSIFGLFEIVEIFIEIFFVKKESK